MSYPSSLSQCTARAATADPLNYQPPSQNWLNNPAWIDGASNPPRFYPSADDIREELATAAQHGYFPDAPSSESGVTALSPLLPLRTLPTMPDESQRPMKPVEDDDDIQELTPLEAAGELVLVTVCHTPPVAATSKSSKSATPKKQSLTKSDYIRIFAGLRRVDFVTSCLAVHDLDKLYKAGAISGPAFKIWFSGSTGGKTRAPLIETDHQFSVILQEVLLKVQKKAKINVSVELDLDTMAGFLVHGSASFAHQSALGVVSTTIPRVDTYPEQSQAEGNHILKLKSNHPCAIHLGEHGQPGHCYINLAGEHTNLTNYRLKVWAAAIDAHTATYQAPPNCVAFDGAHDGQLPTPRARGRLGPHSSTSLTSSIPPANDTATLLMATVMPIVTQSLLALQKRQRSPSVDASTHSRRRHRTHAPPSYPRTALEQIDACITRFYEVKDIDLRGSVEKLSELELTPDILPRVPVSRLCDLTGAVEGHVWKLVE